MFSHLRMLIPLVRRSSHITAMQNAESESNEKIEALKAKLDYAMRDRDNGAEMLKADRNRLLAQSERIRSDLERFQAETIRLRPIAEERDVLAQVVEELRQAQEVLGRTLAKANDEGSLFQKIASDNKAECDRLSAVEGELTIKLTEAQSDNKLLTRKARDFEAECDRLSATEGELTRKLAKAQSDNKLLTRKARDFEAECDRLSAVEGELTIKLTEAQSDNKLLTRKARDFEAECDRLSATEGELTRKLAEVQIDNKLLTRKARDFEAECDRLSATEGELTRKLAEVQIDNKLLTRKARDFEAECNRLAAAEGELTGRLADAEQFVDSITSDSDTQTDIAPHRLETLELQVEDWKQQTESYRAECERLGADSIKMLHEKDGAEQKSKILRMEMEGLEQQLRFAFARDPLLIGTFPRSGTWMLKYFLHFQDHFSRTDTFPELKSLYEAVTGDYHYMLKFERDERAEQLISISHWMCPGVFDLPEQDTAIFRGLLAQLGCFDYQYENDLKHNYFAPKFGRAKIVFVYRNPFDVYRSYADIFERRSTLADRQEYPFNPMAPFGTDLMNSNSDEPFEHFIEGFAESNFIEFFAAYFMSFLHVKDAYPDRVKILRYEDAMSDREKYLRDIVAFGRIGDPENGPFGTAFTKSVTSTDIAEMKKYETQLGHALSGAKTFYGEVNSTHLSTKKRDWRDVFSQTHCDALCDRLNQYEPRILEYLPELQNGVTRF